MPHGFTLAGLDEVKSATETSSASWDHEHKEAVLVEEGLGYKVVTVAIEILYDQVRLWNAVRQ